MNIKNYFRYSPTIDLTAAHIGINKWDWDFLDQKDEENAKEIMVKNKYDVLPVKLSGESVHTFYSTEYWNDYSNVILMEIKDVDTIYYRTSFQDLVRKLHDENKHYFFLSDNREVLGLVSIANLNSQAVYNYLFQLIADIERQIILQFERSISQDDIIEVFSKSSDSHQKYIVTSFQEAREMGVDNTIFHHMYLQDIAILLKKFKDQLNEELSDILKFRKKFSPNGLYTKIRNTVMHPVRPVISNDLKLADLDQFFFRLFRNGKYHLLLKNFQKTLQ